MEQLKMIRALLPDKMTLHAQVISIKAEEMVQEAKHMREILGTDLFIKIPVIEEGIKAMMILNEKRANITATAIYTPMQALMAAKAGARWLAPYVNRLDMIGSDGVGVAISIHHILSQSSTNGQVLGASFKNVDQILRMAEAGASAITAAPEMLEQLLYHPLTDQAVNDFTKDFEKITGKNQTMLPNNFKL
ncbi:MAG TPA: fructose-6-phosphate aldolase [Epulopiscium sp.]|nr:fructose-6-phosphate aldolase [Candidatus Epulonipiscium sp.]